MNAAGRSAAIVRPVSTSHSRAVPSHDAVTIYVPSGEYKAPIFEPCLVGGSRNNKLAVG